MTYLIHLITTYRATRQQLLADLTPDARDEWPYGADYHTTARRDARAWLDLSSAEANYFFAKWLALIEGLDRNNKPRPE